VEKMETGAGERADILALPAEAPKLKGGKEKNGG